MPSKIFLYRLFLFLISIGRISFLSGLVVILEIYLPLLEAVAVAIISKSEFKNSSNESKPLTLEPSSRSSNQWKTASEGIFGL
ncbi:Uncharacterised protein [uncultured archaeon]|nr:Uncharacterised protein [uncultured archaeon]